MKNGFFVNCLGASSCVSKKYQQQQPHILRLTKSWNAISPFPVIDFILPAFSGAKLILNRNFQLSSSLLSVQRLFYSNLALNKS